jgi:hypothetical protein
VNLVIELSHLGNHAVFFEKQLIHVCTLVVVVSNIPVVDGGLQHLSALVRLRFFWQVVNVDSFAYYEVRVLAFILWVRNTFKALHFRDVFTGGK